MNIASALEHATAVLTRAGIPEPRREASSLVAYVLVKDRTFLLTHPEYEINPAAQEKLNEVVSRRSQHEPLQYIFGRQEFYGLDFEVTPDVLIPRPETEVLVEEAIQLLNGRTKPRFLEIGVGSGCISVAILKTVADATATGVDISPDALAVAKRNAEKHDVEGRLELRVGDLFGGIGEKFELIVSNPPYVSDRDIPDLQAEVRDFEPHSALAGGKDGLDVIKAIIRGSQDHLTSRGVLLMEIGFGQEHSVRQLFDRKIWDTPVFLPDLQGIARVAVGKLLK